MADRDPKELHSTPALESVEVPDAAGRWMYRFTFWPEGEVFRRLVDYDEDCRQRAVPAAGLGAKLSDWLGRKG